MKRETSTSDRWQARRGPATLLRAFILLAPIVCSLLLVRVFSQLLPVPTDSLFLYVVWWFGISGAATGGLILVDRVVRRLLPLSALLKLSLVFPDQAPSRFRTALAAGGVESLEDRLREARSSDVDETPAEAAQRLLVLVSALDAHDRLTRGHADRVRAYSRLIAEELGLSRHELDLLNWSALLHDIGKLEVPSEILTKSGKPTDHEWEVLKSHPERGESLVEPLTNWLGEWTDAVGQHHERWDGRGYPHGREGESISLAARIVAVADVFDVITSARSYKSASSTVEAREELARSAGSQLDPRVVRAFLNVSLGRLRFIMGPLSWLAHAPILARVPLTPAVTSLAGTLAVVATAVTSGVVQAPSAPAPPFTTDVADAATLSALADVERTVDEDSVLTVRLPAVTGAPGLAALRVVGRVPGGRALVTRRGTIRYLPRANFNGRVVLHYTACWQRGRCRSGLVRIAVVPVNDKPVAVDDRASGAVNTPVLVPVLRNDSDPDGDALYVLSAGAQSAGRVDVLDSRVRWVPPRGFTGKARFTYRISDRNGGRASATVEVVVGASASTPTPYVEPSPPPATAPGAPPADPSPSPPTGPSNRSPRAGDDVATVLEGASATVAVLSNDSDPDGDSLTLASVTAPSVGRAEVAGGAVRFTAPAAGGTTSFEYVVRDPMGATDRGTVFVTIVAVNDAPSFEAGPDQTVLEGSGAAVVAGWARSISPGPPDEADQHVTFAVDTDRPGLFGQPPAIEPRGTLSFTPAAGANGKATMTVRVVDDGGTANGGQDTSAPQTFTITVVAVNSPPSFAVGADQVVQEDSGLRTVSGWARGISPGPSDESDQDVAFTVSASRPALFAAGPAVSPSGTLSFTPAPNANGATTVTVRAVDSGGTANGGENTSAPQTFTITITPVNDAPVALDDAVPTPEDSTGVTFDVLQNDTDVDNGDALALDSFDGSSIAYGTLTSNGGGSFTYVPDPSFNGTETFTYVVRDSAGATDSATVTITVAAVPTAPTAAADAYSTSAGTALVVAPPGVLANDADEDGDPLTVQLPAVSGPSNGTLALAIDGSFTYTPSAVFIGTDSFTYRVDDGTGLTADAVVTITVSFISASDTLYLSGSGPSSEVWNMTTSAPSAASPVPDYDGDGNPGLTIEKSGGGEGESQPAKRQEWVYAPLVPLLLNGPVTLELWSTVASFRADKDAHPHVYLYDCVAGGTGCVKIAENDVHVATWNGNVSDWVYRELTVGSVSRTVLTGRELRVRLLMQHEDLWVAMTGAYPSALALTLG